MLSLVVSLPNTTDDDEIHFASDKFYINGEEEQKPKRLKKETNGEINKRGGDGGQINPVLRQVISLKCILDHYNSTRPASFSWTGTLL
jgi:hypothetical protein